MKKKKWIQWAVGIGLAAAVIGSCMKNIAPCAIPERREKINITAHRGGASAAPENTMYALAYSMNCSCDYAEIDVQETADGILILLHDDTLKRTAGVDAGVWEMTYEEICQLDAGAYFGQEFRGARIPTLEEAIKFCKGRLDLNIEIKYNDKNEGIVEKVLRLIEVYDFEDQCLVTSSNYSFVQEIEKKNPKICTGYIMTAVPEDIEQMNVDFFSVRYTDIDEAFVQGVHACGKEVHAWTVNKARDIRRVTDLGVDNIITDDPVLVEITINGGEDGYRSPNEKSP